MPVRRRGAFTLVEMLIVIAIVACLAAMLLPEFRRAWAQQLTVQCHLNLRTIGISAKQYLRDHGQTWPPLRSMGRNAGLLGEIATAEGLTESGARHAGGYHWSLILWPYHRDLRVYTCPADPWAERRGDLEEQGGEARPGSPLADAPPESYGLNTMLFRMPAPLREHAGADWGEVARQFQSDTTFTTLNDQRRIIPQLDHRVLMVCGTRGFTVGHQSNVAWRTRGLAERYEWHPWAGPGAFEDAAGFGTNVLFFDGHAEYREDFPSRFEWALELK